MSAIPLKVRRAVHERSGGVCERCSAARATHVHHRKLRSQGGSNDMVNLVDCCAACHLSIHENPGQSYAAGWLVRSGADPADVWARTTPDPVTPDDALWTRILDTTRDGWLTAELERDFARVTGVDCAVASRADMRRYLAATPTESPESPTR